MSRKRVGFTLIELLVVIAVIALLALVRRVEDENDGCEWTD